MGLQSFCTNCGGPLVAGTAFCGVCGTRVSLPPATTPGQIPAKTVPGSQPPNTQFPAQMQDDAFLAGLAASSIASRRQRRLLRRARRGPRRPGARLRGCGCLLLLLALLAGPFIGVALTTGKLHEIFLYVAGIMVFLLLVLFLLGVLSTRRGREAAAEGFFEALIESLLGGG